jgi:hypothetical protein
MDRVEEWKRTTHAELYGEYGQPGLIQLMRTYLVGQQGRDRFLPLKVGVLAIVIPLGYDIIKHLIGWK